MSCHHCFSQLKNCYWGRKNRDQHLHSHHFLFEVMLELLITVTKTFLQTFFCLYEVVIRIEKFQKLEVSFRKLDWKIACMVLSKHFVEELWSFSFEYFSDTAEYKCCRITSSIRGYHIYLSWQKIKTLFDYKIKYKNEESNHAIVCLK